MKKIIAMLLAAILALGLVACAAQPASTEQTPAAEAPAAETPANGASADAVPADDALPFEGVELSLWFPSCTGTDAEYWAERLAIFTAETGATTDEEKAHDVHYTLQLDAREF